MARASATIARLKNVRLSVSVLYVVCGGGWSKPVCIVLMPDKTKKKSSINRFYSETFAIAAVAVVVEE